MSMLIPRVTAARNRGDEIERVVSGKHGAIRIRSGKHSHIVVTNEGPVALMIAAESSLRDIELRVPSEHSS